MQVWNYMVKPVSPAELQDKLDSLTKILTAERRSGRAFYLQQYAVPQAVPQSRSDDPQVALLPSLSIIEQSYNTRVSADRVAKACGMTRFQFSRHFHATFGMTFKDYLLRFRVAEACRLLECEGASVTDVGYAVGFNDLSHFARVFRRYTGLVPSQYASTNTRPSAASMHPAVLLRRARNTMGHDSESCVAATPASSSAPPA
jgi:AraC-like DNA-binding protein